MPAQDLLVKLWNLPSKEPVLQRLKEQGIAVKRVIAPDRARVLQFVDKHFGAGWMHECEQALSTVPSTCYVAVKEREIIGFACFETGIKGIEIADYARVCVACVLHINRPLA